MVKKSLIILLIVLLLSITSVSICSAEIAVYTKTPNTGLSSFDVNILCDALVNDQKASGSSDIISLGYGIGYQYYPVDKALGYQISLINISPNNEDETNCRPVRLIWKAESFIIFQIKIVEISGSQLMKPHTF